MSVSDDLSARQEKDAALLETLLMQVLREHEGTPFAEQVTQAYMLTRRALEGHTNADVLLDAVLREASEDELIAMTRACTHALALARTAQQHHQGRLIRHAGHSHVAAMIDSLREAGLDSEAIWSAITSSRVQISLAAHATAPPRPTIQRKHARIRSMLDQKDRTRLTTAEAHALYRAIWREIASLWETAEDAAAPDGRQATHSALAAMPVLWEAIPAVLSEVDALLQRETDRPLPLGAALFRLSSAIGSDATTGPRFSPATLAATCSAHRRLAAALYHRDLTTLRDALSMRWASDELFAEVGDADEPYRALLDPVIERLDQTRRWAASGAGPAAGREDIFVDALDLAAPLMLCDRSLRACGCGRIADGMLRDILWRLSALGMTLARLDLHLGAAQLAAAMSAVTEDLGLGSYQRWSESERIGFLVRELVSHRPLVPHPFWDPDSDLGIDPAAHMVFETLSVAAQQPAESLGVLVIGGVSQPSDVLLGELLQKAARQRCRPTAAAMHVVPRLETRAALAQAPQILHDLLRVRWYHHRLSSTHSGVQEVVLAHTRVAEDVGPLTAAWDAYQAQEGLARVARQHAVTISASQPGMPFQAHPPGAVERHVRVCAPLESLLCWSATLPQATDELSRQLAALLQLSVHPPPALEPTMRETAERLSEQACRSYQRMLHADERFLLYMRTVTPEPELVQLDLGGRWPRGGRPWGLAWAQSGLALPAWLGLEAALSGPGSRSSTGDWPLLAPVIDDARAALRRADPDASAHAEAVLADSELHAIGADLRARLSQARSAIAEQDPSPSGLHQHSTADHERLLRRLQAAVLVRLRRLTGPGLMSALSNSLKELIRL